MGILVMGTLQGKLVDVGDYIGQIASLAMANLALGALAVAGVIFLA